MSDYFKSLKDDARIRYVKKTEIIDLCDPYALLSTDYNVQIENVPVIQLMDIVNYFVLTHSFFTGQQLKAFKSLEAYQFYKAGFVLNIRCAQKGGNYIVLGEVSDL